MKSWPVEGRRSCRLKTFQTGNVSKDVSTKYLVTDLLF